MVHEVEDGIDVWRTYSTPGYGRDLRSRISNYGTFAWWSALAGMRVPPAGRGGGLVAVAALAPPRPRPWPAPAARASCWRCATSSRTRRSRWGCSPTRASSPSPAASSASATPAPTASWPSPRASATGSWPRAWPPGRSTLDHQRRRPGHRRPAPRPPAPRPCPTTPSWRCTSAPTAPTARSRRSWTPPTACATTRTPASCSWAAATASRRWWRRRAAAGWPNVAFVDPVPKREVPVVAGARRRLPAAVPGQPAVRGGAAEQGVRLPRRRAADHRLGAGRASSPAWWSAPAAAWRCRRRTARRWPAPSGRSPPTARARGGWASSGRAYALEHYDRAALAARFVAVVESVAR